MRLATIWSDLRHGLRSWRSQPSLYAIALTALALRIGANSTIFSVIQTVLIRPLPYKDADRLVNIFEKEPKNGVQRYFVSPSDYSTDRFTKVTSTEFSARRVEAFNDCGPSAVIDSVQIQDSPLLWPVRLERV